MSLGVAYLTGEYPRATDTFIQREVAELRKLGLTIETFSIRRTDERELVGPEQRSERDGTTYILARAGSPLRLLADHAAVLLSSPGRYFRALRLAMGTAPPGPRAMLYQLFYFAEAGVLARAMHRRGLVHLHNHLADSSCSVAMIAAELAGLPFSFTLHGPYIFFEPHRWRLDAKTRRAAFVACISHFARSQAMIFCPPDRWPHLHIVHCGVRPEQYPLKRHHGGIDTEHGDSPQPPRIICVGRLAPVKGVHVLLESLGQLADRGVDAQLDLVGDGESRSELESRAAALGLSDRVVFHGYQSQSAVRDLLGQADVFVSSSFAEGVPVVLMEALAAGLPVVATRIAGVPELVQDGVNGFVVPPGEVTSLTDRLAELIADAELRQRMGHAGRATVEAEFNLPDEAAKLAALFERYAG